MTLPKLDILAGATHYIDHLAPVWDALPKTRRGTFYVLPEHLDYAATKIDPMVISTEPLPSGENPVLVAASGNLNTARKAGRRHVALMEHGCGLSYGGDRGYRGKIPNESPSYAGGLGRNADLFIHPGPHPAARDLAIDPSRRVVVVGSPRIETLPKREPDGIPTVTFSFHWDAQIVPETRSAFIVYRDYLAEMAANVRKTGEFRILGHAHPRIYDRLEPWFRKKGIEPIRSFDDVCRLTDLYAVDNSSTLYEFASTGRDVLVLNAPFYRRGIQHGLRFWDAIPGEMIDEPYDINRKVPFHLKNPDRWAAQREAALDKVYGDRSPGAAKRAAKALTEWMKDIQQ